MYHLRGSDWSLLSKIETKKLVGLPEKKNKFIISKEMQFVYKPDD